jgi:hypothetical protein
MRLARRSWKAAFKISASAIERQTAPLSTEAESCSEEMTRERVPGALDEVRTYDQQVMSSTKQLTRANLLPNPRGYA